MLPAVSVSIQHSAVSVTTIIHRYKIVYGIQFSVPYYITMTLMTRMIFLILHPHNLSKFKIQKPSGPNCGKTTMEEASR
jgi:hypothetical protein